MPDEQGFLAAIREAPDDNTPRLIYADWLDDHGDADRAEFIRVQCEAERLAEFDPRRAELQGRAKHLLVVHEAEWLGPAGPFLRENDLAPPQFRRGTLESVSITASAFLEYSDALFRSHPLDTLQIDEIGEQGPVLAECGTLSFLRGLILGYDNLTAAALPF